jgi:hypothetical protein
LRVLYLTSDPDKAHSLRVDAEVRRVQQVIRGSAFRQNITVEYRPAANLGSLIDGLNDHRPQIVHFSGHGHKGGIATDNGGTGKCAIEMLPFDLLAKAVSATDSPPDVIVLNSCNSSAGRSALVKSGKIVIAMRASVSDLAATAFATRFSAAIAGGQSVKAAFAQGTLAVEAVSISEADTPELFHSLGTNPAKVVLV